MSEQLRLLDVPREPVRLRPVVRLLGKAGVAECRSVLNAAEKSSEISD